MRNLLLTTAAILGFLQPAFAQETVKAPYDYEYLTVSDAERAKTAENVATLQKIFEEAIFPRDWDRMRELYADNYVQHNPIMEDGKEGVVKLFEAIDYSQMIYERSMAIAEGPYVITLSKFKFNDQAPLMVAVDINFIRDGQSREHWDILMPLESETNLAGRTPFDSVYTDTVSVDAETVEANKRLVASFINTIFNEKDVDRIPDFVADAYFQHDPGANDGMEEVANDLKKFPDLQYDIKRIVAENDLVLAHSRITAFNTDFSRVDIWRVRDGKLVEHWGAMQEVPDEMLHRNGMF